MDDTSEPNPLKSKYDHGDAVRTARNLIKDHRLTMALRRVYSRKRDENGRLVDVITPERWDEILDLIEAGAQPTSVMEYFGHAASTLTKKKANDPDFLERFNAARREAYLNIGEDIANITRGIEGYSTGNVVRDALVAKYDLELAKVFARDLFGHQVRADVTHRIEPVILPSIALPSLGDDDDDDDDDDGDDGDEPVA